MTLRLQPSKATSLVAAIAVMTAIAGVACDDKSTTTNNQNDASGDSDTGDEQSTPASLVTTADEPPGNNCQFGGLAIQIGSDSNGNGVLDDDEITDTRYVCKQATTTLMVATDEAAGANCAYGGTRLDVGIDSNGNGTLDASEITSTQYVCNPQPPPSPASANVANGTVYVITDADLATAQAYSEIHGTLVIAQDHRSTVTSLSFPNLTYVDSVAITCLTGASTVSFPALVQIGQSLSVDDSDCALATSIAIDAPVVVNIDSLRGNAGTLNSLSMPALTRITALGVSFSALTSLSLPALQFAVSLDIENNFSLDACDPYTLAGQIIAGGAELGSLTVANSNGTCDDVMTLCPELPFADDHDFRICLPPIDFDNADVACGRVGDGWGSAFFTSAGDFTAFVTQATIPFDGVWIGYDSDAGPDFVWSHSASTYLPQNSTDNPEFWDVGQPDNLDSEHEVQLDRVRGVWHANNAPGSLPLPGLCRLMPQG